MSNGQPQEYRDRIELLAESMADHSAHLSEAHGKLEEIPNSAAVRARQMDAIGRFVARMASLVDNMIESVEADRMSVGAASDILAGIDTRLTSTTGQIHATLKGTNNATAIAGREAADKTVTHTQTGTVGLELVTEQAGTALEALHV